MSYNQGSGSRYGQRDMRQEMNDGYGRQRSYQKQPPTIIEMLERMSSDIDEIKQSLRRLEMQHVPIQLPIVPSFDQRSYNQVPNNVPMSNNINRGDLLSFNQPRPSEQ